MNWKIRNLILLLSWHWLSLLGILHTIITPKENNHSLPKSWLNDLSWHESTNFQNFSLLSAAKYSLKLKKKTSYSQGELCFSTYHSYPKSEGQFSKISWIFRNVQLSAEEPFDPLVSPSLYHGLVIQNFLSLYSCIIFIQLKHKQKVKTN